VIITFVELGRPIAIVFCVEAYCFDSDWNRCAMDHAPVRPLTLLHLLCLVYVVLTQVSSWCLQYKRLMVLFSGLNTLILKIVHWDFLRYPHFHCVHFCHSIFSLAATLYFGTLDRSCMRYDHYLKYGVSLGHARLKGKAVSKLTVCQIAA
jgi:hypothetical protein